MISQISALLYCFVTLFVVANSTEILSRHPKALPITAPPFIQSDAKVILLLPPEVLKKRASQCAAAIFPFPHGFSIARRLNSCKQWECAMSTLTRASMIFPQTNELMEQCLLDAESNALRRRAVTIQ